MNLNIFWSVKNPKHLNKRFTMQFLNARTEREFAFLESMFGTLLHRISKPVLIYAMQHCRNVEARVHAIRWVYIPSTKVPCKARVVEVNDNSDRHTKVHAIREPRPKRVRWKLYPFDSRAFLLFLPIIHLPAFLLSFLHYILFPRLRKLNLTSR